MNEVDSVENLLEKIEGLIEREDLVWQFALDIMQISELAVLQNEKVPISF